MRFPSSPSVAKATSRGALLTCGRRRSIIRRGAITLLCGHNLLCFSDFSQAAEYTNDGTPTTREEEVRWLVNRGRFDSVSENALRRTAYADIPAHSGPLAPNQALTRAARRHSEDLGMKNVLQHESVSGSAYYSAAIQPEPWDRMEAEGYLWSSAAENIAAGNSTAKAAYLAWWTSTGHRHSMYRSDLFEIGTGYFFRNASAYKHYDTMDLGNSWGEIFLTDTLFHDADGNGVYTQGEGVAGIEIALTTGGVAHPDWDRSTAAGSFAIPIRGISTGTTVEVVFINATKDAVTLSIHRDYRTYAAVTLSPGARRVYGTLLIGPDQGNFGFREVTLSPPHVTVPQLTIIPSDGRIHLAWPSESGLRYQPQWTADLHTWSNLTSGGLAGTGSPMTLTDSEAGTVRQRFYRLIIQRNP